MNKLKGIIFSLRDVVVIDGDNDTAKLDEVFKLLKFVVSKGVTPVLISNSRWTNNKKPIAEIISKSIGYQIKHFIGGENNMPYKQKAEASKYIKKVMSWGENEVLYVGSSKEDMQAARNGKLMFLNAKWHADNSPYGFEFESAKDIARFIDCCCIGVNDWFWTHESEGLRVYSIAPLAEFSRAYPNGARYSSDAKAATKRDMGNLPFWGRLMAAKLYFSGIAEEANYLAPYPGHKTISKKRLLTKSLKIIGGSMRANYLEDLITRHKDATKSSASRNQGLDPGHANQLSTICLRKDPMKTGASQARYKNPPLKIGKTVLIVDDICTAGYSFEAARQFINSTGANAIFVSWLKTPGANDYQKIKDLDPKIKPYEAYSSTNISKMTISNNSNVTNEFASDELAKAFESYKEWEWPL